MKKKLIFLVSLCLMLTLCLIPNTFAEKQMIMKIAHPMPVTTPRHKGFVKFKELLEKKSKNTIKVEIYPAGQLGTEPDMIEATRMGTLQGCKGGVFDLVSRKLLIYTMPFLFDDIKDVYKVTRGAFNDKIVKDAEKNGIVIISNGDGGGFRNISNNKRPVVKPEDMKGLKMRTPAIESIIKIMEALGANQVSIPYGDTYMALKTGVADGQENPFTNMVSMKFYEVQKYLTVCNYQFHPDPFYISKKWWDTLDTKTKKLITDCAWKAQDYCNKLTLEADTASYEVIKKKMVVTVLTKAQKTEFVKKTKAVDDYFVNKGYFSRAEIDELRNLIK